VGDAIAPRRPTCCCRGELAGLPASAWCNGTLLGLAREAEQYLAATAPAAWATAWRAHQLRMSATPAGVPGRTVEGQTRVRADPASSDGRALIRHIVDRVTSVLRAGPVDLDVMQPRPWEGRWFSGPKPPRDIAYAVATCVADSVAVRRKSLAAAACSWGAHERASRQFGCGSARRGRAPACASVSRPGRHRALVPPARGRLPIRQRPGDAAERVRMPGARGRLLGSLLGQRPDLVRRLGSSKDVGAAVAGDHQPGGSGLPAQQLSRSAYSSAGWLRHLRAVRLRARPIARPGRLRRDRRSARIRRCCHTALTLRLRRRSSSQRADDEPASPAACARRRRTGISPAPRPGSCAGRRWRRCAGWPH